jgi:hypothetical protein
MSNAEFTEWCGDFGVRVFGRESIGLPPVRRAGYPVALPLNRVTTVIHHHLASPSTPEVAMVQGAYNYHIGLGWSDIAYNVLPGRSGNVYLGRGIAIQGGATGSPQDSWSQSVCSVGNFENDTVTDELAYSLGVIVGYFASKGIHRQAGDRNYNSTACPGRNVYSRIPVPPASKRPAPPDSSPEPGPDLEAIRRYMASTLILTGVE